MATTHTTRFSDKTLSALQGLISVNLDSAEGFLAASQTVNDARLAPLFSDISLVRGQFARQLQQIVASDETPTESGTAIGTAHRWWLKIRGGMTDDNAYAVLAEAERAEDRIKAMYEDAIQDCDAPDLRTLLEQQYVQVRADHDRVRDLRDAHKK
jgi:uncharacterized protein (TIGR02284 family)